MRFLKPATAAALSVLAFSGAHAAEKSTNPCTLLQWQDLASVGATKDMPMTDAGWHQEATPKEIPGSKLFTNMCAAGLKSEAGRTSITLSFDSFLGKVSEQQIHDWLKANMPPADQKEGNPRLVTLGETTCETGQYELPVSQDDGSVANTVEHYIACDQQVGTHHVSLNVHVPEANKAALPTPEQAKALLEKSVMRMKEQSFAVAEKSS